MKNAMKISKKEAVIGVITAVIGGVGGTILSHILAKNRVAEEVLTDENGCEINDTSEESVIGFDQSQGEDMSSNEAES